MKETYTIDSKKTLSKISSTGGTAVSFAVGSKDVFYPWQMIGDKARGGCFMPAPWFDASLRGLKKHGFLRDLKAGRYNVEKDIATFTFYQPSMEGYPWSIKYHTVAIVDQNKLTMSLSAECLGGKAPVLPGFYPYFACDDASKVRVYVAGEEFRGFSSKSRMFPLAGERIDIHIPDKWDIIMKLEGDFFKLSREDPEKYGRPQMVLWSDAPDEFFCVEPILQDQRFFDTPKGRYLEEHEKIYLEVSFEVR
jgi:D-hexose-6-phosphate mutarotase